MDMTEKDTGQCFIKFNPEKNHYDLYHMFKPLGFAVHIEECKTAIEANQAYWKHINVYKQSAQIYDKKHWLIAKDSQDAESRFTNEGNPHPIVSSDKPKQLMPPQADKENDEDWGI